MGIKKMLKMVTANFLTKIDKIINFLFKNSVLPFESLVCGGVSGLGAKVITYPLDVAKKRLQVDWIINVKNSVYEMVYYRFVVLKRQECHLEPWKLVPVWRLFSEIWYSGKD